MIVDRSREAICITNDLTSTSIVSSHLVLGPIYDDAPIRDDYETVEHGIFPSTTATSDDLSDFCHHIESESDFTTSPIDVLPQFQCEEIHNPHHLSEMSDSTIREIECTYFEGVSEPPHRKSVIVDRSC